MNDAWTERLGGAGRDLLRRSAPPASFVAQLATLTKQRFSDEGWLFERKLDGERCLAVRRDGTTSLRSRSGKSLGATYPELVDALDAQAGGDFAVDGEVVAFDGDQTSFARLQQRLGINDEARARRSPVAVIYYLFDVVHRDGWDVSRLPLRARKLLLADLVDWQDPLRYTPHRNADGEACFAHACEQGWEGVIAKRAEAPYRGGRSPEWLKFKCGHDQELVVGGFTAPQGGRTGFGALLVGYHDDGSLRFAGKVGTGFDETTLERLHATLVPLRRGTSPFDDRVAEQQVTWVDPQVVVQVSFTEWTRDGRLRHPSYQGVRDDKPADEVVREAPA